MHHFEPCDQLPNGVVDFQGERHIKNNAQRQEKSDLLLEKLSLKSLERIKIQFLNSWVINISSINHNAQCQMD